MERLTDGTSLGSSVSTVSDYTANDRVSSSLRVQTGSGVHTAFIKWVLGALSPGRDADLKPSSSAKVKNE
jgi:hypothetical protein